MWKVDEHARAWVVRVGDAPLDSDARLRQPVGCREPVRRRESQWPSPSLGSAPSDYAKFTAWLDDPTDSAT